MVKFKMQSITADYVATLSDKKFLIAAAPRYENVPDLKDPDKKIEKLIIKIQLSGDEEKTIADYYPNNNAQKILVGRWGYDMDKWIGKEAEFEIVKQNVYGKLQNVIYIKQN